MTAEYQALGSRVGRAGQGRLQPDPYYRVGKILRPQSKGNQPKTTQSVSRVEVPGRVGKQAGLGQAAALCTAVARLCHGGSACRSCGNGNQLSCCHPTAPSHLLPAIEPAVPSPPAAGTRPEAMPLTAPQEAHGHPGLQEAPTLPGLLLQPPCSLVDRHSLACPSEGVA